MKLFTLEFCSNHCRCRIMRHRMNRLLVHCYLVQKFGSSPSLCFISSIGFIPITISLHIYLHDINLTFTNIIYVWVMFYVCLRYLHMMLRFQGLLVYVYLRAHMQLFVQLYTNLQLHRGSSVSSSWFTNIGYCSPSYSHHSEMQKSNKDVRAIHVIHK